MENIALIGIDLGKNSFHIHCQDRRGKAVYRKKFTRPKLIEFLATCPATTIAMEACGGSHFMARKLEELGHSPKLISPQFVRPFVKSNKNDFVDAEAICEAAGSNARWKWTTEYNRRSIAETAMYRMKQLLGDSLTLRDYDGQVAEAMAMVRALNRMTKAGMPESVRIA
ncbi:transposase [Klebsiella quasipneumoniae]|nr:transposase [Klebsiella quasipneumoniae]